MMLEYRKLQPRTSLVQGRRPGLLAWGKDSGSGERLLLASAALLHSVARNHALIDGNKRTAWLATRVFLRFNGVSTSTAPPPISVAGPFVEEVAQDSIDVLAIAKRLSAWLPVS
ncbi:Fic family protein [Streptomyces sp. 796.1]|uniref:Fic family protein n=1 Tax=Streptomyces sp. 796.1 TaxID=3163029 RepID=UPI0039C991D2